MKQEDVNREFASEGALRAYVKAATRGLWDSEKHFIKKYFTKKGARVLDLGCGTGRTTIPLVRQGFDVTAVDIVPEMIEHAKKIAKRKKIKINYDVGDARHLKFKTNTFDYVLFSNQGWSMIPGRDNRQKALREIRRVLKKDGIFIFTAHPRIWTSAFFFFWLKQWVKQFLLKPIGIPVEEEVFGDRFFERETHDAEKTYDEKQYIHIPSIKEVKRELLKADLEIVEINGSLQISAEDIRSHPPVFYVVTK